MNRKKLFEDYFGSIYAPSNYLSTKEYEDSAREYDFYYCNFLTEDKNAPMLDIGCGGGQFLYYLKKKGYKNFLGIDMSSSQIKFCDNNITPNVELADAFEFLPSRKKYYSAISANDVIEHIPKERVVLFLDLIHQALKPEGVLLLKLPNMSNPFAIDSRLRILHMNAVLLRKVFIKFYMWPASVTSIFIHPCFARNHLNLRACPKVT
jgi:2-polyprenyl-3-methyl-5-hydroxy-6-metoxy-1,4-benzoquinol methylase